MVMSACPGCGTVLEECEGPVHRYMESSPACWAVYGLVLTREYSGPSYFSAHKYTVDSYAVQHPGHPSPQTIQSVAVHLIRLCLMLEHGIGNDRGGEAIRAAAKGTYFWLTPPASLGRMTVADLKDASDAAAHGAYAKAWAESAWSAWSAHHDQIRRWLPRDF